MNCEEIREDLEAYALGALERARSREVDAHIVECDDCADIARDYQFAVSHLSLAVPMYRAAPRLKTRIMGGVGSFRPAAIPVMLRRNWMMATAAVVLAGLAIGGVVWASILASEVSSLRQQNEQLIALTELDADQRATLLKLESELNSAKDEQQRLSTTLEEFATLTKVALDPDLIPTELQGTQFASSANCSYVWSVKQSIGALTCKNLPSTGVSQTYELWATKGSENVALGSFSPKVDGSASLLVSFPGWATGPVTNLWVTLESSGEDRDSPSPQVVLRPAPVQRAQR